MQIAWPWVPARRDSLLEMLPEVQSPQPSQGGGGGANNSLVPLLATLFWLWFSSVYPHGIFYTLAFNSVAFGLSFCLTFGTFSELSATHVIFWKSCSRVDGSSIFTVLGSVKWYKKRTPIGFHCRCVLGKHFFQKIYENCSPEASKRVLKLNHGLPLFGTGFPYFARFHCRCVFESTFCRKSSPRRQN